MSLRFVRGNSNQVLWDTCVSRFLDGLGDGRGPRAHGAHLWLTHRVQRDAIYSTAAARRLTGWLAPPVSFFSDLPELFGIMAPRVGRLRRRALIADLAREHGAACGISAQLPERRGVVQALDSLFGELLPEGVSPDELEHRLEAAAGDEFAERRNAWLAATYRAYLRALGDAYDPRQVHALVADCIEAGGLREALGGAEALHIYGLHSLRTRAKLIGALRSQSEVEVSLYALRPPEDGFGEEFQEIDELVEGGPAPQPDVQPAPDGRRELEWVACEIKRLLLEEGARPHTIAVVARTGREDVRRAHEILSAAGVPSTARIRLPLAEVPALKAIVQLFRGAATGWSYRPLRSVLESAYFDLDVDLFPIDYIARDRPVERLEGWAGALCKLRDEAAEQEKRAEGNEDGPAELNRKGIFSEQVNATYERFEGFRRAVVPFREPKSLDEWIQATRRLLDPGLFGFRERICRYDGCDYEIVRIDQQGVGALVRLLDEWERAESADEIEPREWYARLKRFLESNEIALSTPNRTGVRILEAHEAALFPFDHTFLIHANDGEFPKRAAAEPLFSDEERRALYQRGLPLAHRELTLRREAALWRAVTAGPDVRISYRTADVRGTPQLPSLLVPPHEEAEEIARTKFLPDRPLHPAQANQSAAQELVGMKSDGRAGVVAAPDVVTLKRAVLNAHAETQRREGAGREAGALGPWNGWLRDPVLIDHLKERFNEDYPWSATALERYGRCPFLFLVERVLFLEVREEAEAETSPLVRGGVAHQILERFYGKLKAGGAFPPCLDAKCESTLEEVAGEVFAEQEAEARRIGGWIGGAVFWAIAKRALMEDLRWYVGEELERHIAGKGERPKAFELRFGFEGEPEVVIRGKDATDTERAMRVRGKIDRVDVKYRKKDRSESYHILDYKLSSTPPASGYNDGSVVQVPLYMRALQELLDSGGIELERRPVAGGRYRSLRRADRLGNETVIDLSRKQSIEKYESALRYALSIPERIRGGRFECKLAAAAKWAPYEPGLDVRRTNAQYEEGSRFDE